MKRLFLALLVSFWTLLPAIAAAQTTTPNRGLVIPPGAIPGSWGESYNNNFIELDLSKIPRVTNATKPTKPEPNEVVVVTDAFNSTTCTAGGGTANNTCQWTGSAWVVIGGAGGGGGGGGGGTFADITTGTNAGQTLTVGNGSILTKTGTGIISASTADALTVNPAPCAANAFVTDLAANGTLTCAQPTAANIAFTPTGTIGAPTVQAAIAEVAAEAQPGSPGLTNFAGIACTGGIYATAVNNYACRTPTSANTNVLTITNADGVAGAPVYALTNPFIDGSSHFAADNGSTDLYVACPASIQQMATPAYIRGSFAILWPNTANTGPAQVNFCGLGARDIVKLVGGAGTALATGDILVGQPLLLTYDAPNSRYQVLSTLGTVVTVSAPGTTNQVPYNVGGVLTASTGLSFDPATNRLTVTGGITAGDCTTNCTTTNDTATGLNTANWAISGATTYDIAGTTGTRTVGDLVKFGDAQGRMVRGGTSNKLIQFMIGAENGAVLVDADDQPSIFYNHYGQGITINDVWCETDAGTSTINLQRDDGSPANILTSNLVCSSTGASSSTFSGTENQIASTNRIDFLMVTAATSGTPKRVSVSIRYTLD